EPVVSDLDLEHGAVRPNLVPTRREREGHVRVERARLRVHLAAEARTEAAVETGRVVVAERVGVRLRRDRQGLRERMQAEVLARGRELRTERRDLERRMPILAVARSL